MQRLWTIAEQSFNVDDTGFQFQFTSVHSEETDAGRPAPTHDQEIIMRMWNRELTKCLILTFDRGGGMIRSAVDSGPDMIMPPGRDELATGPDAPGADSGSSEGEGTAPDTSPLIDAIHL